MVKCWGWNSAGQLGDGSTIDSNVPVDVSGLVGGVSAITASGHHTCALTSGGAVKCWGNNGAGQLGIGTTTASGVPLDVSGLASGVRAIAAGWNHTCALTSGGGVKCWGSNGSGQLGNGTTTDSLVPVDVSGLGSGVRVVVAGANHTCALRSDDGVRCWGDNYYGQLGTDARPGALVPVDVAGLTSDVSAVVAGGGRTCALTTGGGAMCWGANGSGGLGNGDTTNSSVPVDVSGLASGVSAIAVGRDHTCALTSSGGVKCWGSNGYGRLGTGTTTDSGAPVDVVGLTSEVTAIESDAFHTCALASQGEVKCWGYNGHGQLGNGTTNQSSVPVAVAFATSSSSSEPTGTTSGGIDHATGRTDVVLRFDSGLGDYGICELCGGWGGFEPGPEFTLYGDGTVIFRNGLLQTPPAEGPIIRASPFAIAHLDEDQIQSLLQFAIGEGGLGNAREQYETSTDTDDPRYSAFIVRAGGVDKRVEVHGPNPSRHSSTSSATSAAEATCPHRSGCPTVIGAS